MFHFWPSSKSTKWWSEGVWLNHQCVVNPLRLFSSYPSFWRSHLYAHFKPPSDFQNLHGIVGSCSHLDEECSEELTPPDLFIGHFIIPLFGPQGWEDGRGLLHPVASGALSEKVGLHPLKASTKGGAGKLSTHELACERFVGLNLGIIIVVSASSQRRAQWYMVRTRQKLVSKTVVVDLVCKHACVTKRDPECSTLKPETVGGFYVKGAPRQSMYVQKLEVPQAPKVQNFGDTLRKFNIFNLTTGTSLVRLVDNQWMLLKATSCLDQLGPTCYRSRPLF